MTDLSSNYQVTGLEWLGGQTEAGLVASTSAGTVTLFGLTGLQVRQSNIIWSDLDTKVILVSGFAGGAGVEGSSHHWLRRRHGPRLSRRQHRHWGPGRADQHPGAGQQEPSQGD